MRGSEGRGLLVVPANNTTMEPEMNALCPAAAPFAVARVKRPPGLLVVDDLPAYLDSTLAAVEPFVAAAPGPGCLWLHRGGLPRRPGGQRTRGRGTRRETQHGGGEHGWGNGRSVAARRRAGGSRGHALHARRERGAACLSGTLRHRGRGAGQLPVPDNRRAGSHHRRAGAGRRRLPRSRRARRRCSSLARNCRHCPCSPCCVPDLDFPCGPRSKRLHGPRSVNCLHHRSSRCSTPPTTMALART